MFRRTLCLLAAAIALVLPIGTFAQIDQSLVISNFIRIGGTNFLTWSRGDSNFAYTVQAADSLANSVWLNGIWNSPWPTPLNQWSDPSPQGGARFYRVLKVPAAQRGALTGSVLVTNLSFFTLFFIGQAIGFTPQYGVNAYRLTYETIDPVGARVPATGLLCLPDGSSAPLRMLTYQHGTILKKSDAPSVNPGSLEAMIGVIMASLGYAAVVPDLVGLGGSPGFHPYHHAVSEATACIDMLRAARAYCASHSIVLTNKLFLMGYSQGGHATMALHRELERYYQGEFTVTASAPMAGAYDLSGVTTDDFLSGRITPNPYYFAYLLAAYQSVYHVGNSLSNMLAAPYDATLPPLLDGLHSETDVNAAMPNPPMNILKPEVLEAFRNNPRHPLRLASRDNDVYDWKPIAPMRLWHCQGDMDVMFANSILATNHFQQLGVTVLLNDPNPDAGHGDCAVPSLLGAKAWFETFP